MASLTQVLASSNAAPIEDINIAGNLNEGLKAGMNLATAKEQVEEKKIQVAQQKEQLEIGKLNSFNGMIKTLNLAKPAIAKQMAPKLKERFQGMGFDPAIIDTVMADPEFGRALFNIANSYGSEIANNPTARAQALRSFEDIGMLSDGLNNMQAMDRQAAQNKFLKEQQERQIQGQKAVAAIGVEKSITKQGAQESKDYKQALRLSAGKFDEMTKKDREGLSQLAEASNMLASGEAIPQSAARRSLAKAYNSGALTDSDVNDFAGDKALASRFIQALETGATGELTDDNIRQLLIIADNASKRKSGNIIASAKDAASRFSRIYPSETPEEEILKTIYPDHFVEANKIKNTTVTTDDEVTAFMKANNLQESQRAAAKASLDKAKTKNVVRK